MAWKMHAFEGTMITVPQAAALTGVPENTIYDRMRRTGCTLEEAVYMTRGKYSRLYEFRGEKLSRAEIAERAGVSVSALAGYMYRYNMSPAESAEFLIAIREEHEYNGEKLSLRRIADISHRNLYRLYTLVVQHGMSPEQAVLAASRPKGKMTRYIAARMLCSEIFSGSAPEELGFTEAHDGSYSFGTGWYRYEVSFPAPGAARLTAIFRDPENGDRLSSAWDYRITRDGIQYKGRA